MFRYQVPRMEAFGATVPPHLFRSQVGAGNSWQKNPLPYVRFSDLILSKTRQKETESKKSAHLHPYTWSKKPLIASAILGNTPPSNQPCVVTIGATRKMKTRNFDCCGATWRKMIFHQNWGRRLPSFCNINIPCGKKPGRHGNQRGKTQVDYGTGWFCWEDWNISC